MSSPEDNSPTEPRTGVMLLVVAVSLAVFLLSFADFPFGRDQGIFHVVSDAVLNGGAVYRDAWDFKTPGIYLAYAGERALFGDSEFGFRAFEILCFLAMGGGFYLLTRPIMDGRAAFLSLTLAVYAMIIPGFWHVGQPETFGAVLTTFAILSALSGTTWGWLAAAGLYVCAAILKPTLGGGVLVTYGFVIAPILREQGWRGIIRPTLAFTAGGVAVLGALIAYLYFSGAWDSFVDALFGFAPNYTALEHDDRGFAKVLALTLLHFGQNWPFLPVLILTYLALGGWRAMLAGGLVLHIFGVVAMVLLGVAIQGKLFDYHYATGTALLALPAGWGLWLIWGQLAIRRWGVLSFVMTFAVLLALSPDARRYWKENVKRVEARLAQPDERAAIESKLYSIWDFDAGSNREAAAWLAANAPPDARLFVWGFEPLLYSYSGLPPADRFIYNVPMRAHWSMVDARGEFLARFNTNPPWSVVVQDNDILPQVNGNDMSSRDVLEQGFPELREILANEYETRVRFGPLEIYTRKPDAG